MANLYEQMKKEIFYEMKFMDASVKGISESEEYRDAKAYNAGIRAVTKILDSHKEELQAVPACRTVG